MLVGMSKRTWGRQEQGSREKVRSWTIQDKNNAGEGQGLNMTKEKQEMTGNRPAKNEARTRPKQKHD